METFFKENLLSRCKLNGFRRARQSASMATQKDLSSFDCCNSFSEVL